MAKIVEISISYNHYNMRDDVTSCTALYNEFMHNGEKYVRLQTFGSNNRQNKGNQSQVLHIDGKIAEQLIGLLQNTFELKK